MDCLNTIDALETASAKINSITLFFSHPSQISSPQNLQRDKEVAWPPGHAAGARNMVFHAVNSQKLA